MPPTIAVFGIGNVLIGDDAAGPSVIRHLRAHFELPGVEVEDLGTPSLDLAARMGGFETVIFVDAVSAKGEPGELRSYGRDEIVKNPPSIRMSPHDPSLKDSVLTVDLMPDGPRTIELIGIIPQALEQFGLSDVVTEAVPRAAEAVVSRLEALGVAVKRREVPLPVEPFWGGARP